jgi:hypothetical protein
MQNHQPADRLSWGDSVFLNLERGLPSTWPVSASSKAKSLRLSSFVESS